MLGQVKTDDAKKYIALSSRIEFDFELRTERKMLGSCNKFYYNISVMITLHDTFTIFALIQPEQIAEVEDVYKFELDRSLFSLSVCHGLEHDFPMSSARD